MGVAVCQAKKRLYVSEGDTPGKSVKKLVHVQNHKNILVRGVCLGKMMVVKGHQGQSGQLMKIRPLCNTYVFSGQMVIQTGGR